MVAVNDKLRHRNNNISKFFISLDFDESQVFFDEYNILNDERCFLLHYKKLILWISERKWNQLNLKFLKSNMLPTIK